MENKKFNYFILVLGNFLPLILAIAAQANTFDIVVIYWLEIIIFIFFLLLKYLLTREERIIKKIELYRVGQFTKKALYVLYKLAAAFFSLIPMAAFTIGSGLFVLLFRQIINNDPAYQIDLNDIKALVMEFVYPLTVLALYNFYYFIAYLKTDHFRINNPEKVSLIFFRRYIVIHLSIIVMFFGLALTRAWHPDIILVIIFIIIKTAVDYNYLKKNHNLFN